ncbi:unnamed protein product [Cyprideis torosa]|uniref:Uncharacterized protein n=1 Tax=Cyprideis torosa TaxID=163714 RepID=A0A7R8WCZ1_9CRUS|nr:unnamed protein product [Cyprideis torosa]CAG0893987.1 unnamed protein product [Cyprideis torosa]
MRARNGEHVFAHLVTVSKSLPAWIGTDLAALIWPHVPCRPLEESGRHPVFGCTGGDISVTLKAGPPWAPMAAWHIILGSLINPTPGLTSLYDEDERQQQRARGGHSIREMYSEMLNNRGYNRRMGTSVRLSSRGSRWFAAIALPRRSVGLG